MRGIKSTIAKPNAKRGSTLVELSIVMALLSIVATMIATFSALVVTYVNRNQAKYDFIEESSAIREDIANWLSEVDSSGSVITVSSGNYSLEVSTGESFTFSTSSKNYTYTDSVSSITQANKSVESMKFYLSDDNSVLKCSVFHTEKSGEVFARSFAFSLRTATFAEEVL